MSRGPWLTKEQFADILALSKRYDSHQDIAIRVGLDRSVVSRVLRKCERRGGFPCRCGTCAKCRNRESKYRSRDRLRESTPEAREELARMDARMAARGWA